MRILVHTIFYAPDLTGVARYTTELCEWLARRGHEVTAIAPPPYYPRWRVRNGYSKRRWASETINAVRVRRCPIWIPRRPSGLKRLLYSLSFALASIPALIREIPRAPDLILVIEPSFLNAFLALPAARCCGARAWLHIQDFEPDLAYDLGQIHRGRAFIEWLRRSILTRFDVISSISKRMLGKARLKGAPAEKLFLLPNWVDPAQIFPLPEPSALRRELAISEDIVVAQFSGSLGAKQGVEVIIEAARLLAPRRELLFVICGEGIAATDLQRRAAGLPNIRFLPLLPANRLNDVLNLADIHLLPQNPLASGSVLPSKLIGMLASGRPVIAAAAPDSEIGEIIRDCGLLAPTGEPEELAAAICALAADSADRLRRGEIARQRALALFHQDVILTSFENFVQAGAAQQPAARLVPE